MIIFSSIGMHRKSLEAAEHLKEDAASSDREDAGSRTDTSERGTSTPTPHQQTPSRDPHVIIIIHKLVFSYHKNNMIYIILSIQTPTSSSQSQHQQQSPIQQQSQQQQQPQHQTVQQGRSSSPEQQGKDLPHYTDDPEAFRNNSIACLRAKAQEHQARILGSGLLLQVHYLIILHPYSVTF